MRYTGFDEDVRHNAETELAIEFHSLPLRVNLYLRQPLLLRDKDEQTYYYDMDGYVCYAWADAENDLNRVIRHSTAEQVDYEQTLPLPVTATPPVVARKTQPQIINNYYITTHNGPIITDSNVTILSCIFFVTHRASFS